MVWSNVYFMQYTETPRLPTRNAVLAASRYNSSNIILLHHIVVVVNYYCVLPTSKTVRLYF